MALNFLQQAADSKFPAAYSLIGRVRHLATAALHFEHSAKISRFMWRAVMKSNLITNWLVTTFKQLLSRWVEPGSLTPVYTYIHTYVLMPAATCKFSSPTNQLYDDILHNSD